MKMNKALILELFKTQKASRFKKSKNLISQENFRYFQSLKSFTNVKLKKFKSLNSFKIWKA